MLGVTNKDISIKWVSGHTLVVQGAIMTAADHIKHENDPTAQPDSKSKFEKLLKKVSDIAGI